MCARTCTMNMMTSAELFPRGPHDVSDNNNNGKCTKNMNGMSLISTVSLYCQHVWCAGSHTQHQNTLSSYHQEHIYFKTTSLYTEFNASRTRESDKVCVIGILSVHTRLVYSTPLARNSLDHHRCFSILPLSLFLWIDLYRATPHRLSIRLSHRLQYTGPTTDTFYVYHLQRSLHYAAYTPVSNFMSYIMHRK